MTGELLFVYGTLRSDSGHAMHDVLARGAVLVGRGEVDGTAVDLGEYPGLVLGGGTAHGELWALHDDALFARLD
ncbi:MAG TPA: gamma-glutamylcyclotransferase family protein, partial [Nannocystaceae bacterium]|nr:gamma-glutamylcyclotransferase family protein [Nannocystaceae bacterium]